MRAVQLDVFDNLAQRLSAAAPLAQGANSGGGQGAAADGPRSRAFASQGKSAPQAAVLPVATAAAAATAQRPDAAGDSVSAATRHHMMLVHMCAECCESYVGQMRPHAFMMLLWWRSPQSLQAAGDRFPTIAGIFSGESAPVVQQSAVLPY